MNDQMALFEGECNKFKRGDRVRDRDGRIGTVTGPVPILPKAWVQFDGKDGIPGPFASCLEVELELVEA